MGKALHSKIKKSEEKHLWLPFLKSVVLICIEIRKYGNTKLLWFPVHSLSVWVQPPQPPGAPVETAALTVSWAACKSGSKSEHGPSQVPGCRAILGLGIFNEVWRQWTQSSGPVNFLNRRMWKGVCRICCLAELKQKTKNPKTCIEPQLFSQREYFKSQMLQNHQKWGR